MINRRLTAAINIRRFGLVVSGFVVLAMGIGAALGIAGYRIWQMEEPVSELNIKVVPDPEWHEKIRETWKDRDLTSKTDAIPSADLTHKGPPARSAEVHDKFHPTESWIDKDGNGFLYPPLSDELQAAKAELQSLEDAYRQYQYGPPDGVVAAEWLERASVAALAWRDAKWRLDALNKRIFGAGRYGQ